MEPMSTREALLKQARRAFAERGYAATSLEDIARGLGLTKAAVYHHWASKRELLEDLLEEALDNAQYCLGGNAPLEERLLAYAHSFRHHVEPLTVLMTAQSGRQGPDQEALQVAQMAMRRGTEMLAKALEPIAHERAKPLAVVFASIVHGAYMVSHAQPEFLADDLLREGVGVFVKGVLQGQPEPSGQRVEQRQWHR